MLRVEIVANQSRPRSWTVKAIDVDGGGVVDMTIFSGPAADDRAFEQGDDDFLNVDARNKNSVLATTVP